MIPGTTTFGHFRVIRPCNITVMGNLGYMVSIQLTMGQFLNVNKGVAGVGASVSIPGEITRLSLAGDIEKVKLCNGG